MGKKAAKSTRKFAASGELKRTIKARRKHKAVKQKTQTRSLEKERRRQARETAKDESDAEGKELKAAGTKAKGKAKSVDDLLSGAFLDNESGSDDGAVEEADAEESEEGEESDVADDESFASLDGEEDEGAAHAMDLTALKTKDPEFYKYLQENDKELLEFNVDEMELPSGEEDEDMDEDKTPVLTSAILKQWQKSLIETHSLRALRRLLIAFRAAAFMNDENTKTSWRIDNAIVFNKLVTTTLRYTPIIAAHHMPYKTLPNEKFKPPASTPKSASLIKLLLSHIHNAIHLIKQLPSKSVDNGRDQDTSGSDSEGESDLGQKRKKKGRKSKSKKNLNDDDGGAAKTALIELALTETGKLAPYVVGSRKAAKAWLKACLELWSSGADSVRITAFLAIRRLSFSADEAIVDLVQKNTYLTLLRSSKSSSHHTIPSLTLMKNSASELYALDRAAAYTTAFGYIRQLAMHLRTSTKVKTKEAYRQVYNWQFVHCIDFWALVLARGCEDNEGEESELKPLIYPLVQIGLGAVGLIPSNRYHPLHLHILRSLYHLGFRTDTYIPIPAHVLPILTAHLTPISGKSSGSTVLRPLDLGSAIRAPTQYTKTHVLAESIASEAVLLLAESVPARSVALPEVIIPITSTLRRALKRSSASSKQSKGKSVSGKVVSSVKALVEHLEESAKWTTERRKSLQFGPAHWGEVESWERSIKEEETPIGKWVKVLRKQREARRKLVEDGGGVVDI